MNTLSIRRLSATLAAFVLAFISFTSAHAQTGRRVGTITVPFAFEFGSHQFEAGRYAIDRVGDKVISISNEKDNGMALITPTQDQSQLRSSNVVFHKVGGQYFLRQIHIGSHSVHAYCGESKTEKQALKIQLASNHVGPENVELAALESVF